MNHVTTPEAYGVLAEPTTLRLQRLLPGPIERVWAYLTESELRRQWLARGDMALEVGAAFELTWCNDELSDPPGQRPEGFGAEHSMASRITELDPPRRLAFSWQGTGEVCFDLAPQGDEVLLTLTHHRVAARTTRTMVGAGWHAHLDVLAQRLRGNAPPPFWDTWVGLRQEYERRLPA